jgi:hypothetical protein
MGWVQKVWNEVTVCLWKPSGAWRGNVIICLLAWPGMPVKRDIGEKIFCAN